MITKLIPRIKKIKYNSQQTYGERLNISLKGHGATVFLGKRTGGCKLFG